MSEERKTEFTLDNHSARAKKYLGMAQSFADNSRHKKVEPIHFFYIALEHIDEMKGVLKEVKVDQDKIKSLATECLSNISANSSRDSFLSEEMIDFLQRAEREVDEDEKVEVKHLIYALSSETKGGMGEILKRMELPSTGFRPQFNTSYVINLTDVAKSNNLSPVIGRHAETRRLIQVLGRCQKNHPMLVGEVGVGKKSIVNSLAAKIAAGNVSSKFLNLDVIKLDAAKLISGVKQRGDVEERVRKVLEKLKLSNTILFIDGIESLFGQNAVFAGSGDLISSLLSREELRLIVSTTPEGLRKISEKDVSLVHQFTKFDIEPSTPNETVEILRGIAPRYEDFHGVFVGDPAIQASVKFAKRYLQNRFLPEAAIDLLDEASSRKKFETDGISSKADNILSRHNSLKAQLFGLTGDDDRDSLKAKSEIEKEISVLNPEVEQILFSIRKNKQAKTNPVILGEEDIAAVLEDWTGIPVAKMLEGEADKMANMLDILGAKVVGQEEAIRAVSKAVRRSRLGLQDSSKPIGSFLFPGPSGVGKTETAKALAKFLFEDEKAIIRIDMSEFGEKHMAQRLIGSPPGYAQSEEGGLLTEAIRKNPYSVILFDEIEKAHPDVFNLLLQVLDDGRLTDGRGKTADFTNSLIIMTTNIGSKMLLDCPAEKFQSEQGIAEIREEMNRELHNFLRPELMNRIDEIVVYRPLSKHILRLIADIHIDNVSKLLEPKGIKLEVSEEAKNQLVEIGFDPKFGARPLLRAITKNIKDSIAERLTSGEFKHDSNIYCTFNGSSFVFKKI